MSSQFNFCNIMYIGTCCTSARSGFLSVVLIIPSDHPFLEYRDLQLHKNQPYPSVSILSGMLMVLLIIVAYTSILIVAVSVYCCRLYILIVLFKAIRLMLIPYLYIE